jgi:hypothetical protein
MEDNSELDNFDKSVIHTVWFLYMMYLTYKGITEANQQVTEILSKLIPSFEYW